MKKSIILLSAMALSATSAIAQKYHVTSVERSRITVDSKYDVTAAQSTDMAAAEAFMTPYKHEVDSIMSPVVGRTKMYMSAHNPESELSNLLADIMVWGGIRYDEKVDIGIYNMGGIRASLPEGEVTFGDIVNVAPFENKISFLTLTGQQLKTLFNQFAHKYGAAVSHSVKAVFSKDYNLISLSVNDEPVDDTKEYRISTIDYLIQGNDGFAEFANATNIVLPQGDKANTRYIIADYFLDQTAQGNLIERPIEGRITIK